nr:hypothetical protein BaRGS_005484 [Batillaria attramentaria]
MRLRRSVTSCAKVTLCLLNLWVLCVILVVALGHWRVFDADLSLDRYDNSHLVVMRELNQEPGETQSEKERVSTMQQWCRKLRPRSVDISTVPAHRLSAIMVDRQRRLLFCQIPGVALNDWRRIFIYLTGKVNVTSHQKISAYDAHSKYGHLIKKLSDFKPSERKAILEDSLKVVFVRDPLERLVSNYQNKFVAKYSKYFHEAFGRKIIQKYRRNATAKALKEGSDVRFNEFVRFVLDTEHDSDAPLNEHWERYYKQCQPCLLNYDFIGKFETLVDDTREALSRAGVLDKLQAPYVADTFRNSEKTLKSLYQTVSASDLKKLWKIYYPDYNLFSYPYPEVLHNLLQQSFSDY